MICTVSSVPVLYLGNGVTSGLLMLLIPTGECQTLLDDSAGGSFYLQATGRRGTISLSIVMHHLILQLINMGLVSSSHGYVILNEPCNSDYTLCLSDKKHHAHLNSNPPITVF